MGNISKKSSLKCGQHLALLRKQVGLSQRQLALKLGVPQSNIAFWEHSDKPPRSELLPILANLLGVSVDVLLYPHSSSSIKKLSGPTGKLRKVFDQASNLPRHQQLKIVEVVSLFIKQFQLAKKSPLLRNSPLQSHNRHSHHS